MSLAALPNSLVSHFKLAEPRARYNQVSGTCCIPNYNSYAWLCCWQGFHSTLPCTARSITVIQKSILPSLHFPACYFESYSCTPTPLLAKINPRKRGYVTPSFSFSRCNMTLEEIDQEMYFWTQFWIALSLTFKVVLLLSRLLHILYFLVHLSNPLCLYFCGVRTVSHFCLI